MAQCSDAFDSHSETFFLNMDRILYAADYSAKAHINQRRKNDDSPYINHPIGVAHQISRIGKVEDPDVIIAALLHDTVEDTHITILDIERDFGSKIKQLVAEVSDDKSLSKVDRKKQQIAHAASISTGAKYIKLSDKLYNLKDILSLPPKGWSLDRVQGYFVWAWFVVEQIRGTNAALEHELDKVFSSDLTVQIPEEEAKAKNLSYLKLENDRLVQVTYGPMVPESATERNTLLSKYLDMMAQVNETD